MIITTQLCTIVQKNDAFKKYIYSTTIIHIHSKQKYVESIGLLQ